MFEEYIGKYVATLKIKAVDLVSPENTIPALVKVTFGDESVEIYNSVVLKTCLTENASDLTSLREMKVVPVAESILKILLEARFPLTYFDYLVMKVKASIDMSADKAQTKLWGKSTDQLNVADIDDILLDKK